MTLVLCILDGWGIAPDSPSNAIRQAKTPNFDHIIDNYPNSKLQASSKEVGLPCGQMGNSEVGHMSISSGRVIKQDLVRINDAIEDKSILDNQNLKNLLTSSKICHLLGLFSDGGVHSHQNHIIFLAKILAQHDIKVKLHLFSDGRDTSPKSMKDNIDVIENLIKDPNIELATVAGRYYAMDRDNRWDRVEKAFDAIVLGVGEKAENINEVIEQNYQKEVFDEFIKPTVIEGYTGFGSGDSIMMTNFRADRVRQILASFLNKNFNEFDRKIIPNIGNALGIVEYSKELSQYIKPIFENISLNNMLPEIIANQGMKQLRIAETEKYAHVTFFFNGGKDTLYKGEERILIESKKVATYDLYPAMSAIEVTDKLIEAINSKKFDIIIVNYANADMVAHSGDLAKTVIAIETIDSCLGRIKDKHIKLIITADHGNAEEMFDKLKDLPHTAHTINPVPFIIVDKENKNIKLSDGTLADVAPTILKLLDIKKPAQMTGSSLIKE